MLAKQTNVVTPEHDDPILDVAIAGVSLPPGFSTTYGQLLAFNDQQSLAFLNYYNSPSIFLGAKRIMF